LPGNARELLDELLGDPELSADQVYMLQSTIRESGALEKVEDLISKYVGEAKSAVDGAGFGIEATTELFRLADRATRRSF
jgi:geranylgeranyl diphosphate synthase type I